MTITRDSTDTFNITIHDRLSGLPIVGVKMTPEDFAFAITSLAHSPAEYTLKPSERIHERVGKERVTRYVNIAGFDKHKGDKERLRELIAPHLVDGWELHCDGMGTRQKSGSHTIILRKFVDPRDSKDLRL